MGMRNQLYLAGRVCVCLLGFSVLHSVQAAPIMPRAHVAQVAGETETPVPTATDTPIPTATDTPAPTLTGTRTITPTPTPTRTLTPTPTPTRTPPTLLRTPTVTNTPARARRSYWFPIAYTPLQPVTGNQFACAAHPISVLRVIAQNIDNQYNLYRFTTVATRHTVEINGYSSTGFLQLFEVIQDACTATNPTKRLKFVKAIALNTTPSQSIVFDELADDRDYVLSVNTTGRLTQIPYTLELRY
jgi:hypothetical protein